MGKRWGKFAIALVVLAAGVQAAPAAAAEPAFQPAILAGEDLPEHVHALRLAGSNGYRIEIIAVSEGLGSGSQVYVGVGSRTGLASYNAPALVTADAIQADLGRFGRIDLTLYPSGREKTIQPAALRPPVTSS